MFLFDFLDILPIWIYFIAALRLNVGFLFNLDAIFKLGLYNLIIKKYIYSFIFKYITQRSSYWLKKVMTFSKYLDMIILFFEVS